MVLITHSASLALPGMLKVTLCERIPKGLQANYGNVTMKCQTQKQVPVPTILWKSFMLETPWLGHDVKIVCSCNAKGRNYFFGRRPRRGGTSAQRHAMCSSPTAEEMRKVCKVYKTQNTKLAHAEYGYNFSAPYMPVVTYMEELLSQF